MLPCTSDILWPKKATNHSTTLKSTNNRVNMGKLNLCSPVETGHFWTKPLVCQALWLQGPPTKAMMSSCGTSLSLWSSLVLRLTSWLVRRSKDQKRWVEGGMGQNIKRSCIFQKLTFPKPKMHGIAWLLVSTLTVKWLKWHVLFHRTICNELVAFRSPKRHGNALQITQTERKSLDDVGSPQEVELLGYLRIKRMKPCFLKCWHFEDTFYKYDVSWCFMHSLNTYEMTCWRYLTIEHVAPCPSWSKFIQSNLPKELQADCLTAAVSPSAERKLHSTWANAKSMGQVNALH